MSATVVIAGLLATPSAVQAGSATPSSFANAFSNSELSGVTCESRSDCWAVGRVQTTAGGTHNEALHWNGKQWGKKSTPNPDGTGPSARDGLAGVDCVSRSDCWAVGFYANASGAFLNEALHWNGKFWSLASTPQPGGTVAGDQNLLNAIACTSASDCWAVGFYATKPGPSRAETLHWNGRKWSSVLPAQPTVSNDLQAVSCTSRSDCWAVGYQASSANLNEAIHWNGHKWKVVSTPQPEGTGFGADNELSGISCVSRSACLAVGPARSAGPTSAPPANEALRWNGKKWSKLSPFQNPGAVAEFLSSASCTSARRCWAVGSELAPGNVMLNQALRLDGHAWTAASMPQPAGTTSNHRNVLNSVSCVSDSDCWAVGALTNGAGQAVSEQLHWNGKRWKAG